jgi:3-deoxy-7-phosphoheptulonate synthase
MIEGYLVGGRQDSVGGPDHVYSQSITDACLGWEDSEKLILDLYREC